MDLPPNFFSEYRDYLQIYDHLSGLYYQYSHVHLEKIGYSLLKKPIYVVRIGSVDAKHHFLITSLQHAREWLSVMLVMWIIDNFAKQRNNYKFLDEWAFHFIPIANPDGFLFTFGQLEESKDSWFNPYWRKNMRGYSRTKHINKDCKDFGVDLNRNWSPAFGQLPTVVTSDYNMETYVETKTIEISQPREIKAEDYCGTSALSEPETLAVYKYIKKFNFKLAVDFHSFSQFILIPWGLKDTNNDIPNIETIGNKLKQVILNSSGKEYEVKLMYNLYNSANEFGVYGCLQDVITGEDGKFSGNIGFTIELPPPEMVGLGLPMNEKFRPGIGVLENYANSMIEAIKYLITTVK